MLVESSGKVRGMEIGVKRSMPCCTLFRILISALPSAKRASTISGYPLFAAMMRGVLFSCQRSKCVVRFGMSTVQYAVNFDRSGHHTVLVERLFIISCAVASAKISLTVSKSPVSAA